MVSLTLRNLTLGVNEAFCPKISGATHWDVLDSNPAQFHSGLTQMKLSLPLVNAKLSWNTKTRKCIILFLL